jgi:hypothetical protein
VRPARGCGSSRAEHEPERRDGQQDVAHDLEADRGDLGRDRECKNGTDGDGEQRGSNGHGAMISGRGRRRVILAG